MHLFCILKRRVESEVAAVSLVILRTFSICCHACSWLCVNIYCRKCIEWTLYHCLESLCVMYFSSSFFSFLSCCLKKKIIRCARWLEWKRSLHVMVLCVRLNFCFQTADLTSAWCNNGLLAASGGRAGRVVLASSTLGMHYRCQKQDSTSLMCLSLC